MHEYYFIIWYNEISYNKIIYIYNHNYQLILLKNKYFKFSFNIVSTVKKILFLFN